MDELEHYLDGVCRRMGGAKALREHVRQELREHLLDAADRYRREGLSESAALARAIDDFGGPDEVRSELEATYGHRLMAVVIDKAREWKQKMVDARWLWSTWAPRPCSHRSTTRRELK
ncbi:MAG: permease prefix domain 1-containing protein [Pirellulales bacterium]